MESDAEWDAYFPDHPEPGVLFWGGPEDGLTYVTEGEEIRSRADAERVVNEFYGDTQWRVIETKWIAPIGVLNKHELEWTVAGPTDRFAKPAWLLVHLGLQTVLQPDDVVRGDLPNPFFEAESVDRSIYGQWMRAQVVEAEAAAAKYQVDEESGRPAANRRARGRT